MHLVIVALVLAPRPAAADVTGWQLSEVVLGLGGDPQVRFLELEHLGAGCLYPSSRVEIYDGEGQFLAAVPLVAQTTCYGAPTYLLLATPQAAAAFAVSADVGAVPALPNPGQACFASSGTRYDCVRWGAQTLPIVDFFGTGDLSSGPAPSGPLSLARRSTSHVIAADWQLAAPSPRGPNDGTPWSPPDAGPTPAPADAGATDAAVPSDAAPTPDAGFARPDAAIPADGGGRFLDLETGGGGCRAGQGGPSGLGAGLLLVVAIALRRQRRPTVRSRRPRS